MVIQAITQVPAFVAAGRQIDDAPASASRLQVARDLNRRPAPARSQSITTDTVRPASSRSYPDSQASSPAQRPRGGHATAR